MFSIAIDLINAARASKMSPEDIEQNPLLQCAELFQWQDFVAIDNGTHPLWTAYDYDVTRLCVRFDREAMSILARPNNRHKLN